MRHFAKSEHARVAEDIANLNFAHPLKLFISRRRFPFEVRREQIVQLLKCKNFCDNKFTHSVHFIECSLRLISNYFLCEFTLLRMQSSRNLIYRDFVEHEKSLFKHIFSKFITCCYHMLRAGISNARGVKRSATHKSNKIARFIAVF